MTEQTTATRADAYLLLRRCGFTQQQAGALADAGYTIVGFLDVQALIGASR